MPPRRVDPGKERGVAGRRAIDEGPRRRDEFLVRRFHALARQGTRVLDAPVGVGADDTARPEALAKPARLRVVLILGLLLGIEVVEIAEEFVEAMGRGQELVLVAEVVLAELARRVALGFEHFGDRHVTVLDPQVRTGNADLRHARAQRRLARDEARAPGGAALVAVVVEEADPLVGDAVDVRRAIAHEAVAVGADVTDTDIVAPDHEDVGPFGGGGADGSDERCDGDQDSPVKAWSLHLVVLPIVLS